MNTNVLYTWGLAYAIIHLMLKELHLNLQRTVL